MSLPPITWLESPFKNLRDARYPIRGVVSHRIVGTLPSARVSFGVAPGTSRKASTHFGIGYVRGVLTIDQYVDLSDMAWGNGDVRSPTWAFYQAGVNPNLTTVSIEHEDGGVVNRGRVDDAIWRASMELQKLITSGDARAIRAAGVRVRYDHHAAQLAEVPKDGRGFIDHHQIAGPNKPYCFRRWLDDAGFVEGSPSRRDRLLAHLRGEDMKLAYRPKLFRAIEVAELRHEPDLAAELAGTIPVGGVMYGTGSTYDQDGKFHQIVTADRLLLFVRDSQVEEIPAATLEADIAAVVNARLSGKDPFAGGGITEADARARENKARVAGFDAGKSAATGAYTLAGTKAAMSVEAS